MIALFYTRPAYTIGKAIHCWKGLYIYKSCHIFLLKQIENNSVSIVMPCRPFLCCLYSYDIDTVEICQVKLSYQTLIPPIQVTISQKIDTFEIHMGFPEKVNSGKLKKTLGESVQNQTMFQSFRFL